MKTDFIQCETTFDTVEIHRGRNDYEWRGNKGKTLLWTLPVLVEKNADEILTKIYNCEYWQQVGKGRETSIISKQLMDFIWFNVMPKIDIKSMRKVVSGLTHIQAMNRAQHKGIYVISDKKKDTVIGSNECYTFYQSVEFVVNYFLSLNQDYFKEKVVYCNCDDTKSAFWIYFYNNFHKLGLKKLIATSYDKTQLSKGNDTVNGYSELNLWSEYNGYILYYDGNRITRKPPEGNKSNFHGDFREKICMDVAKNEADIIMTNPPFGELWEQYVKCMYETGKKLIFWGNNGATHYNWFMPFLNEKKIHIVDACSNKFETSYYMTPNYYSKKVGVFIYTTEDLSFQKPDKKYFSTKQEMLDNGLAYIDDRGILVCDRQIPVDTDETLAVSINIISHGILNDGYEICDYHRYNPRLNGKKKFARILIRKN